MGKKFLLALLLAFRFVAPGYAITPQQVENSGFMYITSGSASYGVSGVYVYRPTFSYNPNTGWVVAEILELSFDGHYSIERRRFNVQTRRVEAGECRIFDARGTQIPYFTSGVSCWTETEDAIVKLLNI